MDSQGTPRHWEFAANFDGKDYPIAGDPVRDTVALKRISAYVVQVTDKKAGKKSGFPRWTVSKDGKTLTITQKGTNSQGQPMNLVLVYDKQ